MTRSQMCEVLSRSSAGVSAAVEITFNPNSDIETTEVTTKMLNASKCEGCLLANSVFSDTNLCDKNPCDAETTTCNPESGSYNCSCLENYIETNFSSRMCIACPSGSIAVDSKYCDKCPFGYSGFNCNDSWKLLLVVVGSLLGGLLLITLIILPIVACRSPKTSSKKDKNKDTGKPHGSQPPAKAPLMNSSSANSQAASRNGPANSLSAFANAGVPRIPRATTTNSWDSRTNLEMTPSNSRQNLIPVGQNQRFYDDDHDDMNRYAQVRPQINPYAPNRPQINSFAPNRPQINSFAPNRPQINPYAQSQGHSNPYFTHDDGRRFN